MKTHFGLENINEIKNSVVTTGTFDGVHLGHTMIIKRLNQLARKISGVSVLITFHPHPRKVLYPDTVGKNIQLINSQEEKIEHLSKTGLDHLIIVEFTEEFSKLTSINFIRDILVKKLDCSIVVVGFNHHFGYNREGNYEYLYELGKYHDFTVEEIPEQDIQNETVSSTKIRKAIDEGNVQRANAYLDHIYLIKGKIGNGSDFFKEMGTNTYSTEIEEDVKLIPPEGLYAASVTFNADSQKCVALIECNDREQKKDCKLKVDIFFFDEIDVEKGADIHIYFHKKMNQTPLKHEKVAFQRQFKQIAEVVEELIY